MSTNIWHFISHSLRPTAAVYMSFAEFPSNYRTLWIGLFRIDALGSKIQDLFAQMSDA